MVPRTRRSPARALPAPRDRGDDPTRVSWATSIANCSPRPRGWSRAGPDGHRLARLLLAPAGMVPSGRLCRPAATSAPRARRDGPRYGISSTFMPICFPRQRGWSRDVATEHGPVELLPAPAGVIRRSPGDAGRVDSDAGAGRLYHRRLPATRRQGRRPAVPAPGSQRPGPHGGLAPGLGRASRRAGWGPARGSRREAAMTLYERVAATPADLAALAEARLCREALPGPGHGCFRRRPQAARRPARGTAWQGRPGTPRRRRHHHGWRTRPSFSLCLPGSCDGK